jgi:hypothetical protein
MSSYRRVVLAAVAVAALVLPSCGGDSPTGIATTPPPTTLPPCTQSILFQGGGSHPSHILVRVPFAIATPGRLDLIFDWTFASNLFGLYVVTAGSCPIDSFNANACTFLLRSESATKPRKTSLASIATGNYEMLVANYGSQDDSVSTQIIVSTSSCPAIAAAPLSRTEWKAGGPLRDTVGY